MLLTDDKATREATPEAARSVRRGPERGVYVGSTYAERTTNWPMLTWSPDPARTIRFDDREAAEAEVARVQSFAANARLREVG